MKESIIKEEHKNKIVKIVENEDGGSPVIGVLLMVLLTVFLAAIVITQASALTSKLEKIPMTYIDVKNNGDTGVADIKITHKGGDSLTGGDWGISIVPAGESPVFKRSTSGNSFSVGDQIIITNSTNGNENYTVTNNAILSDTARQLASGKYNVQIILYSHQTVLIDNTVEVT